MRLFFRPLKAPYARPAAPESMPQRAHAPSLARSALVHGKAATMQLFSLPLNTPPAQPPTPQARMPAFLSKAKQILARMHSNHASKHAPRARMTAQHSYMHAARLPESGIHAPERASRASFRMAQAHVRVAKATLHRRRARLRILLELMDDCERNGSERKDI